MFQENDRLLCNDLKQSLEQTSVTCVEFVISKDGYRVPLINGATLHSIYSVERENDRFKLNDNDEFVVFIGFAGGLHILPYRKCDASIFVIPIEYSSFKEIFYGYDYSSLFKDISLRIGNINDLLEFSRLTKFKSYRIVIHPVIERLYPEEVLKTVREIKNTLNPIVLDNKTIGSFDKLWKHNAVRNLIDLENRAFDDEPLIIPQGKIILIAGAGPGLDNVIDEIINHRDRLFILAADTAGFILMKHGIKPDWVFTFDPQYYSRLSLLGMNKTIRIFHDPTAAISNTNLRKTLLLSDHPYSEYFTALGTDTPVLSNRTRNIGGSIVEFAKRYLKNTPIVTAGIDFGGTEFRYYASGSYINDYLLSVSGYFKPVESADSAFFYKYPIKHLRNGWFCDSLMETYAAGSNDKNISTLTMSPFVGYKKISSIKEIELPLNNQASKIMLSYPNDLSKIRDTIKMIKG